MSDKIFIESYLEKLQNNDLLSLIRPVNLNSFLEKEKITQELSLTILNTVFMAINRFNLSFYLRHNLDEALPDNTKFKKTGKGRFVKEHLLTYFDNFKRSCRYESYHIIEQLRINLYFYKYKNDNVIGYREIDTNNIYINLTAFTEDIRKYHEFLLHEFLHILGYSHGNNFISPKFLFGWKQDSVNYKASRLIANHFDEKLKKDKINESIK